MFKQTIQIFGRIKPTNKTAAVRAQFSETGASLEFLVPRDLADGIINHKRENYKFRFRKVFEQHIKQDVIFDEIAKPVAESVLAGYNGTIFAYGQTGSGKTFTITGGAEHYADRGIIPRILSYLYERFNQSSVMYTMHISYLEIYNEVGYDLLDSRCEASRLEDLPKVMIMEDTEQNIHLKNLSMQQSGNVEEALNLLFLGDTNRMIAETPMNQASTRSHCVFTIHLCRREPGSATLRRSKLHLVDLAGSDRVSKTGLDGQLLTEAKYINLSLHYLEQVIIALSEKNRSHIPYRNSMLTSVLRDSLGGNCMTTMIATMAVDKRNLDVSFGIHNPVWIPYSVKPLENKKNSAELTKLNEILKQRDDEIIFCVSVQIFISSGSKLSMGKQEAFEIFIRDHEEHQTIEENTNIFKERAFLVSLNLILREEFIAAMFLLYMTKITFYLHFTSGCKFLNICLFKLNYFIAVTGNDTQDKEENDPLEESLCNQIKQEKVTYNNNIGHLQALRTETEHLQLLIDRVKVKIRKDFQTWWSQEALNLQVTGLFSILVTMHLTVPFAIHTLGLFMFCHNNTRNVSIFY
uniref:Kinesin family member 6 n=1 Tax=Xiphophorus couchianus TaxID=32473 RepID=A0A3B5LVH7_9TELE